MPPKMPAPAAGGAGAPQVPVTATAVVVQKQRRKKSAVLDQQPVRPAAGGRTASAKPVASNADVEMFRVSEGVARAAPGAVPPLDVEAQDPQRDPNLPPPVLSLPVDIQRGFLRKSLGLLVSQLFAELCIATGIVWYAPSPMPGYGMFSLMVASFGFLLLLSKYVDKHRYHMPLLLLYTLTTGAMLGFTNPAWKSLVQFQVLGYTNAGLVGAWLAVQSPHAVKEQGAGVDGEAHENPIVDTDAAAGLASVVALVTAIITAVVNGGAPAGNWPHWVASIVFGTGLSYWFTHDAHNIMANLGPDQYLTSIVHFYSDLLKLLLCCLMTSIFCGAGGQSN